MLHTSDEVPNPKAVQDAGQRQPWTKAQQIYMREINAKGAMNERRAKMFAHLHCGYKKWPGEPAHGL